MYNEFMKDEERMWQICFHVEGARKHYIDNLMRNVSAKTVEEAIAKLRKDFPSAKVRSVDHKGAIHIN